MQGAAGGLVSLALLACKKKVPDSCVDTSGLEKHDLDARIALAYGDATPFPDKTCEACQQFVAPKADGACGTCKLFKGSVHPYGYCKSFALKS
jgi:hypothetical protein